MITSYASSGGKLQVVEGLQSDCWIRVVNPNAEEMAALSETFSIPMNFLSDPLDENERARIDSEDGVRFFILRVPVYEETEGIDYTTMPLGIIMTDKVIITISRRQTATMEPFVRGAVRNVCIDNKSQFLLKIAYQTSKLYLDYLQDINRKTEALEEELHKSLKNEGLAKLLDLEKSLVYFSTSLRSNESMLEKLQKVEAKHFSEDDLELLDDVLIETKQAIDMTSIYTNIQSGLMDAFASIISNNLNMVMKFLTAATIILMIPNLIASIYGMNIDLPLQENPYSFVFLVVLSTWLSLLAAMFFLRRQIF